MFSRKTTLIGRRQLLLGTACVFVASNVPVRANSNPAIHVVKGRGCGCCTAWVRILEADGFAVTDEEWHPTELARLKRRKGIPANLSSCHTAECDGYVIEGHVPPDDIHRLIAERPEAIGITVPEMPYGSPGMGPEDEREAYNVLLINHDGTSTVFSSYNAAK